MTPEEVIEQARTAFGERTEITLSDDEFERFLNQAITELYGWLPPDENRDSIEVDAVALTSGKGEIPTDWDKLLSVTGDEGPYTQVQQATISNIDHNGPYMVPETPVWYYDGESLFVRPDSITTVDVSHTEGPIYPSVMSNEIEGIPTRFHPLLVHLVTAYAYAQEEDLSQAELYRGFAQSALSTRVGADDGGS